MQQAFQRDQQRLAVAAGLIRQRHRNVARVAGGQASEHRLHGGGVGIDVRHHDQDIPRAQAGVGIEGGQQLVVKNFDLAQRAVGDMKAQAVILLGVDGRPGSAGFTRRAQLENIVLQLLKQARRRSRFKRRIEQVDAHRLGVEHRLIVLRIVEFVEQAQIVAALLAPGGQQRLGVQMQFGVVQGLWRAGAALLAPTLGAQQVLMLDDIGPVMAAGVVHAQQHLADPGNRRQRLQRLTRQGGDAEHDDPARQSGWALACGQLAAGVEKALMNQRPAGIQPFNADVVTQPAPQRRLPALVRVQRPGLAPSVDQLVTAIGPGRQPVGAIHLILIEQVGQPLGQLVALAQVVIVGQKVRQRLEGGLIQQLRQQTHQPPAQPQFVQRRRLGHGIFAFAVGQHGAIGLPQKTRWQGDIQRRRDAGTAGRIGGQGQLQPLADAVALHQNHLVFQRRQRLAPHPGHRQIAQRFQLVAVHHQKAGCYSIGGGNGRGSSGHGESLSSERAGGKRLPYGAGNGWGYEWGLAASDGVQAGMIRALRDIKLCPCTQLWLWGDAEHGLAVAHIWPFDVSWWNCAASGCDEFFHVERFAMLLSMPELILRLLIQPALCRGVEGDGQSNSHFRADTSLAVQYGTQRLAANVQGFCGRRDRKS